MRAQEVQAMILNFDELQTKRTVILSSYFDLEGFTFV
jgi:hypothetical protein